MVNSIASTLTLLNDTGVTGAQQVVPYGGFYQFSVDGTFGGATAKLQVQSPDGVSWLDIPDVSFTAEGIVGVYLPVGALVRVDVSGGAPANMFAAARLIGA